MISFCIAMVVGLTFFCFFDICAMKVQRAALLSLDDTARLKVYDHFAGMKLFMFLQGLLVLVLIIVTTASFWFQTPFYILILPVPLIILNIIFRIYVSRRIYAELKKLDLPENFYQAQKKASMVGITGYSLCNVLIVIGWIHTFFFQF